MKNIYYYSFNIGRVGIVDQDGFIVELLFVNSKRSDDYKEVETKLIKNAYSQLDEYFKGTRKTFDLPLNPNGTIFQKKVWNALLEVNYGELKSYKDVAVSIGNQKACRAVGLANNKNPIPIIIPCHRIIGSNGKLVGYALGLDMKQSLIDLEKSNVRS